MVQSKPTNPEHTFSITEQTAADIWIAANDLARDLQPWVGTEDEAAEQRVQSLINAGQEILKLLPADFREAAALFNSGGNEADAMVLRGLTIPPGLQSLEHLERTFPDRSFQGRAAGVIAVGMAAAFGPPIAYATNPYGAANTFLGYSRPWPDGTPGTLADPNDTGWHSNGMSLERLRPSTVALFCIRGQADAITRVAPARRVVEALDDETLAILGQPLFRAGEIITPGSESRPYPVISRRGRLSLNYSARTTGVYSPENSEAEAANTALERLVEVLNEPGISTEHTLEAGEVLAISGHTVYRRSAFSSAAIGSRSVVRVFTGGEAHREQNSPFITPHHF